MTMQVTLTNVSLEGLELAIYNLMNDITPRLASLENLDTVARASAVAYILSDTGHAIDKLVAIYEDSPQV